MVKKNILFVILLIVITSINCYAQNFSWAKSLDITNGNVNPLRTIVDKNNNIYVVGSFTGTINGKTAVGAADGFLVKFDNNGTFKFFIWLSGASGDALNSITTSNDGNYIYFGGYFIGSITIKSSVDNYISSKTVTSSKPSNEVVIAKIDTSGNFIIDPYLLISGTGNQRIFDIKVDVNNDLILCGQFDTELIFPSTTVTDTAGKTKIFMAKLNEYGTLKKRKIFVGSGVNIGQSMVTDLTITSNAYYLSGYFASTMGFDINSDLQKRVVSSISNSQDGYIYKTNYDLQGEWVQTIRGSGIDWINTITADNVGNIYVGGMYTTSGSALIVDSMQISVSRSIPITTSREALYCKYLSNGALDWFRTFGSSGEEQSFKATYNKGYMVMGGFYGGACTIGNESLTYNAGRDAYGLVFDQFENVLYAIPFSNYGNEKTDATAIDNDGNYIFVGDFNDTTLTIGPTKLTNPLPASTDMFIVKYKKGSLKKVQTNIPVCVGTNIGSFTCTPVGPLVAPYTYHIYTVSGTDTTTISNTNAATGLAANKYYIDFTDGADFAIHDSVTIIKASTIVINHGTPVNVSCYGDTTGAITLAVTGGTSPFTYRWNTTNGSNLNITAQNQPKLGAGTYNVTVTDADGCTASDNGIVITEPTKLNITGSTVVHYDSPTLGSISITETGGTPTKAFAWTGPSGFGGSSNQNISGLNLVGAYKVVVTDSKSCKTDTTIMLLDVSKIGATITSRTDVLCKGNTTGAATVTAQNALGALSYDWRNSINVNIGSTNTISSKAAGTYKVIVTDAGRTAPNDTISVYVSIKEPVALLTATTTATKITCNGYNDATINLIPTGGTRPYTYEWSKDGIPGFATTEDLTGLAEPTTNYEYTITDANACTKSGTVLALAVANPSEGSVTGVVTSTITCTGEKKDGKITVSTTGGTTPFYYTWSNGVNGSGKNALSDLDTGSYTFTVKDANNCPVTNTHGYTWPITYSGGATLSLSVDAFTNITCNGVNNGTATVHASNGVSPYNYIWNTIPEYSGVTATYATGLGTGTYNITAIDKNGCKAYNSVLIADMPALGLSLTSTTNVKCNGEQTGEIVVNPSGGSGDYEYQVNGGSWGTSNVISGLAANTYTIVLRDKNNQSCTYTGLAPVNITEPAALNITTVTPTNVSCYGGNNGSLTITATGGTSAYEYSINNGSNYYPSNIFLNLTAQNYSIQVRDANLCVNNYFGNPVTITQPLADLTANASITNVACKGNSSGAINITPAGGTSPYTFKWNNGATTEDLTFVAAGNYADTITDANNCKITINATVTEPIETINNSATITNVLCYGNNTGAINLTVSGGTTPYTFLWSNGATTEDISGVAAGNYNVTITDAKMCQAIVSKSITQPLLALQGSTLVTNVTCKGNNNGAVNLTVTGGTEPYTFLWDNPLASTTEDISNLLAGTYTVVITDNALCTSNVNVTVNEPALTLTAGTSVTNVLCNGGNTGSINLTVNGGTQPYAFNWDNSDTTEDISNLTIGNYNVTVTDFNLCTTTASGTVTEPTAINISNVATTQPGCNGANNGQIVITANEGTAPLQYSIGGAYQLSAVFSNLAVNTYTVTVLDANNCEVAWSSNPVSLNNPSSINIINIQITNILCNNGNNGAIKITASGGTGTLQYALNNNYQPDSLFTGLSASSYNVKVKDVNGCEIAYNSNPVELINPPLVIIDSVSKVKPLCYGNSDGQITIHAKGGTGILQYSKGGVFVTDSIFTGLPANNYNVKVIDANACEQSFGANPVTLTNPALVNINSVNVVNPSCSNSNNGQIEIIATGGTGNLQYSIGGTYNTNNLFTGLSNSSNTVSVTDANNCIVTYNNNPVLITNPSAINIDVQYIEPTCVGNSDGKIVVLANGGTGTLQYSDGGAFTINNTFNAKPAGNYNITVKDANACLETWANNPVVLSSSSNLKITNVEIQNPLCFAQNTGKIIVTATSALGSLQYALNGNYQNFNEFNTLPAGNNYFIKVKDNNCELEYVLNPIVLTEPNKIEIGTVITTNQKCYADSVGTITIQASGGTGILQYSINQNAYFTNNKFLNLKAGSNNVWVKDVNNCEIKYNNIVEISQPNKIAIDTIFAEATKCYGQNTGSIRILATGGTGKLQFSIGGNYMPDSVFTGLNAGLVKINIKDANACEIKNIDSVIVKNAEKLNIVATSQNISCYNLQNGKIKAIATGGTVPYSWYWEDETGLAIGNIDSVMNLKQGNYTVLVTDKNTCTKDTTVNVVEPNLLGLFEVSNKHANVTCFDNAGGSITLRATGGNGPFEYKLDNGSWQSDSVFAALKANTNNSKYLAWVREMNDITCVLQIPVNITITQPTPLQVPEPILINTIAGSSNGKILAEANGATQPYNFKLIPDNAGEPDINNTTGVFENLSIGYYTLLVYDNNGCGPAVYTGLQISTLVNIHNNKHNNTLLSKLYPNPAHGWVTLEVLNIPNNLAQVQFINMQGVVIYESYYKVSEGTLKQNINIGSLFKGIYSIKVNGTSIHKHLVVQ